MPSDVAYHRTCPDILLVDFQELLLGQKVVVVRTEEMVISGGCEYESPAALFEPLGPL
jgi:hypothetical protein